MHVTKEDKAVNAENGSLCSLYTPRHVRNPPATTLSMDSKTFMCNFGCSVVTEDRATIVRHLLESHGPMLEAWCMKESLMRATLIHLEEYSGGK